MESTKKIEVVIREVEATKLEKGGVYLVAVSASSMTHEHMRIIEGRLEDLGVHVVVTPVEADDVTKAVKVFNVPEKEKK